jgi:hypothetical protein
VAAGFLIAAVRCELAAKITRSGESPPMAVRALAAVALLLELPIFLVVPLLIKLESPGPVLAAGDPHRHSRCRISGQFARQQFAMLSMRRDGRNPCAPETLSGR